MIERAVVSFGYIPESKVMLSRGGFIPEEAIINYSTFEEHFMKQTKGSTKRNIRRRVEEARNRRSSDVESDTGSDGLAVNSGGSGKSGDWGPPKSRQRLTRRRHEERSSLTDSGISLSKADSLSELSAQKFGRKHEQDLVSVDAKVNKTKPSHDTEYLDNRAQPKPMKRSSSCSALPSNMKPLDRHNPRINPRKSNVDVEEKKVVDNISIELSDVEKKEIAVLEQCYKNEGLVDDCGDIDCSYIVDCSPLPTQSRFPLPDHLNYPLCKYRYKSQSILNRASLKPLKKLKDRWRKLKTKKRSSGRTEVPCIYSETSYLDYLNESSDEENETILARLATNPNQKSFMKKLFSRVGTKTYSAQQPSLKITNDKKIHSIERSTFQRSTSTRSIPEALKNMWTKVHDLDLYEQQITPQNVNTLSRATSMPSISCGRSNTELPGTVMYFNEPGFDTSISRKEVNYFSNLFKPIETPLSCPQTPRHISKQTSGNDVITGVLGQQITQSNQMEINNAILSSGTDNIVINVDEKAIENIENDKNSNRDSSCYELSSSDNCIKPKFYSPSKIPSSQGRYPCCQHHQFNQYMYPYYLHANFVHVQHPTNDVSVSDNYRQEKTDKPDKVVLPLDVEILCERKAERRKISEMIFDTFV